MRWLAVVLIASLGLSGCDSVFPWTPSVAENDAAQSDSCNGVAMRQQIDAGYSGFDEPTRQKVYQEALAQCSAWQNRLSGKAPSAVNLTGAASP